MFPVFLVTFREILEVVLVLGVVLAATEGLPGRVRWVGLGIVGGVLGSVTLAIFTDAISNLAGGIGQELFNAAVLIAVSIIIGWTAIWMRSHAKVMMQKIRGQGARILEGELPKYTITFIVALTVLREGAEIVLFSYGMLASGAALGTIFMGSIMGLVVGGLVGILLYKGLILFPTKYIFQVTTWMLVFISAGMASVGVKYLVAAGYFSALSHVLFDFSGILSEKSLGGQILHALFGYSERPMVIQIMAYIMVIMLFVAASRRLNKPANV